MTHATEPAAEIAVEPPAATAMAVAPSGLVDAGAIVTAVDETAFTWDLASDAMAWLGNAAAVLGMANADGIRLGSAYQLLVASEHAGKRYRSIWEDGASDTGNGVAYQTQYRFRPAGRRSARQIWIEERGRWYAGPEGKPARAVGVLRMIDNQREEIDRLRRLSEYDDLTGLLNRRMLLEALDKAATPSSQIGRSNGFLIAAINNLALINQTFGFDAGDSVIANVADRLRRQLRGGDSIGRYSTNKFGLVIQDCDADGLKAVARRLTEAVSVSTIRCAASEVAASISIGAVEMPLDASSAATAVTAALEALDDARQTRQDRLVIYKRGRCGAEGDRRALETADSVLLALKEQRMRVALQAVVHAGSREPAFYECLLRMATGDGALIAAAQFVPVAEQLGLARMIDARMLELAVGLVKADADLRISFNVSAVTTADHQWLLALHGLTAGDRQITGRLMIEITESMALTDFNVTAAFVDAVKDLGCKVALDDFGAGYTSFRNLQGLKPDMVKLDGSFVRSLKDDGANRFFVQSMVDLARNFGMTTVAEMVGDAQTADILAQTGVDYLQGYYFGEPQAAPFSLPVAASR